MANFLTSLHHKMNQSKAFLGLHFADFGLPGLPKVIKKRLCLRKKLIFKKKYVIIVIKSAHLKLQNKKKKAIFGEKLTELEPFCKAVSHYESLHNGLHKD